MKPLSAPSCHSLVRYVSGEAIPNRANKAMVNGISRASKAKKGHLFGFHLLERKNFGDENRFMAEAAGGRDLCVCGAAGNRWVDPMLFQSRRISDLAAVTGACRREKLLGDLAVQFPQLHDIENRKESQCRRKWLKSRPSRGLRWH